MALRDREAYKKAAVDWKFLDDALPGKVGLSDIDGILHRGKGNRFLVLEAKHVGQQIPRGQFFLLQGLARLPNFDVLILWMSDGAPSAMQHIGTGRIQKCTADDVRRWVVRWFNLSG